MNLIIKSDNHHRVHDVLALKSVHDVVALNTQEINIQTIDGLDESSPQILIFEKECLELKSEAGYWRAMHGKAILREKTLQQTIKELKGQIRDLRHRIFGKKSEKSSAKEENGKPKDPKPKRPRGQQPGSEGHGLTERPDLPVKEENVVFAETPICPVCGKPYISHEDGEKESIRYEVNVKAHVRIYNRQCMKKGCCCKGAPDKFTAPIPANVIPKSPYDISIWEAVLLTKFHYCQPTNRLLNQYAELGLPISPGTIAGGLKTLKKMFQPVYDALYNHQMTEDRFHNDESSWKVFETVDNKIGNRWWLWVSRSVSVVYFQIAPGRGADVPVEYFKNTQQQKIIVICDLRYSHLSRPFLKKFKVESEAPFFYRFKTLNFINHPVPLLKICFLPVTAQPRNQAMNPVKRAPWHISWQHR